MEILNVNVDYVVTWVLTTVEFHTFGHMLKGFLNAVIEWLLKEKGRNKLVTHKIELFLVRAITLAFLYFTCSIQSVKC